jgi:hypothetical protein
VLLQELFTFGTAKGTMLQTKESSQIIFLRLQVPTIMNKIAIIFKDNIKIIYKQNPKLQRLVALNTM